jgi:hypothetical protein
VESARPGGPAPPDEDAAVDLTAGRYDSFVVRVFSRGPANSLVHGQVTHVATRRMLRFTELDGVVSFILTQVGQRPTAGASAEGTVPPD